MVGVFHCCRVIHGSVEEFFKLIQWKETLLVDQDTYLGNLTASRMYMATVSGPFHDVDLITEVTHDVIASAVGSDDT